MKTESITTHDIRVGDRIIDHGMVLLVDREPYQTRHPVNKWSPTLATRAVIENWDELVESAKTDTWIAGFIVGLVRGDRKHQIANGQEPDEQPRWTIQGNGLARWERVL